MYQEAICPQLDKENVTHLFDIPHVPFTDGYPLPREEYILLNLLFLLLYIPLFFWILHIDFC